MFDKSLTFAGALAAALVWSAAAYAAPGEATQSTLLRSGPGVSYPVIARSPTGATVDLFSCSRWCSLDYRGLDGYVRAGTVASVATVSPDDADDDDDDDNGPFDGGFFFDLHGHHGHDHGGHGHGGHDGGHHHH